MIAYEMKMKDLKKRISNEILNRGFDVVGFLILKLIVELKVII